MQVGSKLMELRPSCLFLELSFLQSCFPCEFVELLSDFFILVLNVLQIALSGIKVMLVLAAIEASVVLLYYLSLFIEKLALFVLVLLLFFIHKFATTVIAT